MGDRIYVVELTEYERNAAANALAENGLNPRRDQRTARDRAYYKLVHAPSRDSLASGQGQGQQHEG